MSVVPADLRFSSPWRVALPAFLLLVAAILLLYRDTAAVMVGIWWRSETFAHCILVLPISLWLVWRQRECLAALTPRPQPWMLLTLLVAGIVWLLSSLVAVNVASQFALVAMLQLAVPAVLGIEVATLLLFPLLFLFFGVPFGEFVLPTMMEWTADFTVAALQLSGVPVFREGQNFMIPSGNWSVIDECSGVRYLMASFMVGTLFAHLNYRSSRRRIVFMAVSVLVPIVANWFRAYMVVMLAHLSGNRIATGVDHILYGWLFFGLIISLMFIVGTRWSEREETPPTAVGARWPARVFSTSAVYGCALAATAFVALPPLLLAVLQRAEGQATPARIELPAQLADGWTAAGAQLVPWGPNFGTPSAASRQSYAGPAGATVGVYLAYYRGQSEDHKVVSSQNMLVGMRDPVWSLPVYGGDRDVAVDGRTVSLRSAQILARAAPDVGHRPHLVVWRVYWIDGRFIASDIAAKSAGALARLRGRGDEGAVLVLYADADTTEASGAALQAFAQANLGRLDALLQRTRNER